MLRAIAQCGLVMILINLHVFSLEISLESDDGKLNNVANFLNF